MLTSDEKDKHSFPHGPGGNLTLSLSSSSCDGGGEENEGPSRVNHSFSLSSEANVYTEQGQVLYLPAGTQQEGKGWLKKSCAVFPLTTLPSPATPRGSGESIGGEGRGQRLWFVGRARGHLAKRLLVVEGRDCTETDTRALMSLFCPPSSLGAGFGSTPPP